MHFPASTFLLLAAATSTTLVSASSHTSNNLAHAHKALHARQEAARAAGLAHHEARLASDQAKKAVVAKRTSSDGKCKNRVVQNNVLVPSSSSSSAQDAPASTSQSWNAPATSSSTSPSAAITESPVNVAAAVVPEWTSSSSQKKHKSSSSSAAAESTGGLLGSIVNGVAGVLNLVDPTCGSASAQSYTSNSDGPNGAASWLTCGIDNGGWTPPYIHINELIAADLATSISSGNSPFGPCADYVDRFYAIGGEFGIPPILIASFAMQESTCNPHAVGGGGEQGMFQITVDKCGSAPGGNCQDVDYNMRTAMKYFSDTLASNGGDTLLSIGQYNGWRKGMTYSDATAAANSGCCRCQNNLDYLHQMLNGFMQGLEGSSFGNYWNLKVCG